MPDDFSDSDEEEESNLDRSMKKFDAVGRLRRDEASAMLAPALTHVDTHGWDCTWIAVRRIANPTANALAIRAAMACVRGHRIAVEPLRDFYVTVMGSSWTRYKAVMAPFLRHHSTYEAMIIMRP